jgi:tyrosinase
LRAPYWDWAANLVPPAEVYRRPVVKIQTPDGEKEVPNPLVSYKFGEPVDYSGAPDINRHQTVRHQDANKHSDVLAFEQ